ncbi:MAG: amidophosphoribosyltransferase [Planctomycetes bacterium]|nr:amidophosphoribosyltransferase [Planctomycetota bacterium]
MNGRRAAADRLDKPREACGLFGVHGHPQAAAIIREGLFALQHRGQEGAGIAVACGSGIQVIRGQGLLTEVDARTPFDALNGCSGIGHVRYSTTGASSLRNVQPLTGEGADGMWAVAHNGNLVNAGALRRARQEAGALFHTGTDSEVLLHLLVVPNRPGGDRVAGALEALDGAFAFLLLNGRQLMAARDRYGLRPLSLGRLGPAWVFASETCALEQVGATHERDLEPGELATVDADGLRSTRFAPEPPRRAQCVFEMVYFARPDSRLFGHWVHEVRVAHGRRLAREHPAAVDCVTAIPDGGHYAAQGFACESCLPLESLFVRNHYAGRAFIVPDAAARAQRADRKLAVLASAVRGRRVAVVDDSLVRGTTIRRRVAALRQAGAAEIHLRIASPAAAHPCFYGIDFPTRGELAASGRTAEDIRRFVNADSLGYLSPEGLVEPLADGDRFCRACFTGDYPTAMGSDDKTSLDNDSDLGDSHG